MADFEVYEDIRGHPDTTHCHPKDRTVAKHLTTSIAFHNGGARHAVVHFDDMPGANPAALSLAPGQTRCIDITSVEPGVYYGGTDAVHAACPYCGTTFAEARSVAAPVAFALGDVLVTRQETGGGGDPILIIDP